MSCVFPFSAIVGQEELKCSLMLNVIDPLIGGVLIMGEKGTAKSTAVRSLAALLPSYEANACPSSCEPLEHELCTTCKETPKIAKEIRKMCVVELPLGTTEDRLLGSLDIKKAIQSGEKHFEPGILSYANRNFLYVDEVNLLEDHLVDLLLDAAAMGMASIEREGVSYRHPSRFVLVGSMNPEEGELRPQLLDRFGLCVDVKGLSNPEQRLQVLTRRLDFDADHHAFIDTFDEEQEALASRLIRAKEKLPHVVLPHDVLVKIVTICAKLALDGHRGDITLSRAAKAYAALMGKDEVSMDDVRSVASFVLLHRQKRLPFESVQDAKAKLDEALK